MSETFHPTEYQRMARRTANLLVQPEDITPEQLRLLNWALGLAGEAGEVVEIVKKHVFHGHRLDVEVLISELGDIGWYRANMATDLGESLAEVDALNELKLRRRYPEGFSQSASKNR